MPDTLHSLVTVDAVQAQSGDTYAEPERAQVEIFVERAKDEMLRAAPAIDVHLSTNALTAVTVRGIGVDVVIRAIEDVRIGRRVTQEAYPDVTTSFSAAADELVYLTAAEASKLIPSGTPVIGGSGAYIVSLSGN
ncbi:hypothetical protein [Rhodococcoides fascians]|uniref:hypothetical protein n=1 Tax=Rhodococcoides fascians TaxID=1828 RepID=UPI00056A5731|nr:hypothetical protein [Rhodococcus fascians]